MRKLEEITIFDFTDIGGQRATSYDIIEKYMREFFADDPRTQADVMKALKARPTKTLTRGLHRRPLLFAQYQKIIRKYQNPISAHIPRALNTFNHSAHLRIFPHFTQTAQPSTLKPHHLTRPSIPLQCAKSTHRHPQARSILHSPEPTGLRSPFSQLKSPRLSPRAPTNLSRPLSRAPADRDQRDHYTTPLPKILPKSCQKSLPILTHSNPFQPIPTIPQNPQNPSNSRPAPIFPPSATLTPQSPVETLEVYTFDRFLTTC